MSNHDTIAISAVQAKSNSWGLIMEDVELDFGAITIDNSTYKGEGYKFNEGLLAQMRQFKQSPVAVLQTDIVHNEAIKHIGQEISKAKGSVETALRSAMKHLKITSRKVESARELLSVEGSEFEIAEHRLLSYYELIGAQLIESSKYTDFSVLLRKYFATEAPFEGAKDKKNEFPDAIALLALEGWAEENDVNVIAVSQDKGWMDFAEQSDRITLISSLAEALEVFQPHNKVASIIAHIREDSLLDEPNHVLDKIEQAIIDSVDGSNISIDVSSYLYVEWDDVSASYLSHELDCDDKGLVRISIVRIDDESISLKVGAIVEVEVEAGFSFSVRDSIDKDYVSLGGSHCTTVENYHTDILLTLTGDFSQEFDNIEVVNIEVLETIAHANFGDIEPDWGNDYEE